MTRDELIELGRKIVSGIGTQEEQNRWYEEFSNHVPHPRGANLFFYPENYNTRRDDHLNYNPSVEEVVDQALAYQPLVTPAPETEGQRANTIK